MWLLSLVLLPKSAVELYHAGELRVASLIKINHKTLHVALADDQIHQHDQRLVVDAGQIVGVWPPDETPTGAQAWQAEHAHAYALLRELPPHMLDLKPLWTRLTASKARTVTTAEVADALFLTQGAARGASAAARRIAAGKLLSDERILFKRRPGHVEDGGAAAEGGLAFSGGGFAPLARALAASRAEASVTESIRLAKAGEPFTTVPSQLPLLGELEMAALGLGSHEPSAALGRILAAFGCPPSPEGARRLLLESGLWVQDSEEGVSTHTAGQPPPQLEHLEPFPRAALELARTTAAAVLERRKCYATMQPSGAEVKPPRASGLANAISRAIAPVDPSAVPAEPERCSLDYRVDLRERFPRTFAIDGPTTEFRDDAVSIQAPSGAGSTCILAVHIADVSTVVPQGSLLDTVARLRLQSLYASSSPLHMLPPALLHRASLSEDSPNECLTALITLDSAGKVRGHELVRSIIGPVRALSFDEVDEVLRGSDGMDSMVHRDLRELDLVARRRAEGRGARAPDADADADASAVRWRGTLAGGLRPEAIVHTASRAIVGESLALYSFAARGAAKRHNLLRLPQTENQRVGTAPLRRYADMVSQRQLSAVLRGDAPMPPGEVASLEIWIRQKQREIKAALSEQQKGTQNLAGLRELEAICARQAAVTGGGRDVELTATVVQLSSEGDEVEVKLVAGGLHAHAAVAGRRKMWPGMEVRVRLKSVDAQRGRIDVVLVRSQGRGRGASTRGGGGARGRPRGGRGAARARAT